MEQNAIFGGGAFNWDGAGMDATAMPQAMATKKMDISELVEIKGYIAGRKNTLTKSFNQTRAQEMYKEVFEAESGGQNSFIKDGQEIKKSFSQKNFRILLGEGKFEELQQGNFYKLNTKEGNPEFLVLESRLFEEAKESDEFNITRKKVAVSSPDSKTLVIKPRSLSDVLYSLSATGIVYIKVDGVEKGVFSPQKLNSLDKHGNNKIAIRYYPIKDAGTYAQPVPQLGVIKGIPYTVNKSFEGETVNGEIHLSNERQIMERYPELMDRLNEIGLTMPREQSRGTDQTIPYADYADVYEAMGISESMLEKLRAKKSSSRSKEYSLADISAGFMGDN